MLIIVFLRKKNYENKKNKLVTILVNHQNYILKVHDIMFHSIHNPKRKSEACLLIKDTL